MFVKVNIKLFLKTHLKPKKKQVNILFNNVICFY